VGGTFVEENFDAGAEFDVLEHVVDFDLAAGERGPAGGDGHVVDAGRRAEYQSHPDRGGGDVGRLGARDARLAARDVLHGHRERALRARALLRAHENVIAVALYIHTTTRRPPPPLLSLL